VPDQLKLIRRDVERSHQGEPAAARLCSSLLLNIGLNLATFLAVSLRPELTWATAVFDTSVEFYDSASSSYNLNSRNVSIGLLLNFLKVSVEGLERSVDLACDLVSKEKNLHELVELEKKQLVANLKAFERMSEVEKSIYLKNVIRQKLKANKVKLMFYSKLVKFFEANVAWTFKSELINCCLMNSPNQFLIKMQFGLNFFN